MEYKQKKYIRPQMIVGFIIVSFCCLIKPPLNYKNIFTYLGYAISGVTIVSIVYVNYLWKVKWIRILMGEETPILKPKYGVKISYKFNDVEGNKVGKLILKQTLLTTNITLKTDINRSDSIVSKIVEENGQFVLYYTYITNPTAMSSQINPIQYGTTKIIIDDVDDMSGKYWTTSKTIGDLHLTSDEARP